jgi:hypothetical protein
MSNAVSSFILATSLRLALNHVDKASLIKNLANDIDKVSDANLGSRSEKLQEDMVRLLLLPLAKELMKEDHDAYKRLLIKEAEPFREPTDGIQLTSVKRMESHKPSKNNFSKDA